MDMKEEVNALQCGHENELIAFLYGELDDIEMRSFRSHLHDCAACKSEFASFTNIRESVVAWRNESLGASSTATVSAAPAADSRRPSALAALREFFDLSPLWLKGAVAFASLLFCLFAVLAAARLREVPSAPQVSIPDNNPRSEQQFRALVEQRVKEELQRIKDSETTQKAAVAANNLPGPILNQKTGNRRVQLAANVPTQNARRPLSKVERKQLAADLRLVAGSNDGDLNLLDDRMTNSN
jgi:anti-sigma factor RsiW